MTLLQKSIFVTGALDTSYNWHNNLRNCTAPVSTQFFRSSVWGVAPAGTPPTPTYAPPVEVSGQSSAQSSMPSPQS